MHVRWFRRLLDDRMPHASCPACCHRTRTVCPTSAGFPVTEGQPSPVDCPQALGGKNCLAPANSLSSSAVDVWRGDSAGCDSRPQLEHLPSATGASPIFQHSAGPAHPAPTLTGLGLPGCPRFRRTEAEKQGCSPFPCLPAGSSDDARPPNSEI